MDEFRLPAEVLIGFVDDWSHEAGESTNQIDLIGFSQGAALSYTLTLLYPGRTRTLAALSGFMPDGAEDLLASEILDGKTIFIAHGRQENMIPVEEAHRYVALLAGSGAQVTYCESDGGHKVTAAVCFSWLSCDKICAKSNSSLKRRRR
jgi:phospholipase/carboxylesterase